MFKIYWICLKVSKLKKFQYKLLRGNQQNCRQYSIDCKQFLRYNANISFNTYHIVIYLTWIKKKTPQKFTLKIGICFGFVYLHSISFNQTNNIIKLNENSNRQIKHTHIFDGHTFFLQLNLLSIMSMNEIQFIAMTSSITTRTLE